MMLRPIACSLALAAAVASCRQTPPTTFYTLSPIADVQARAGAPAENEVAIGLGEIVVPDYVDRPQVVVRTGQNTMELAELNSWVEPVRAQITRTIALDLSYLLDTRNVFALPSRLPLRLDYIVEVQVGRFDSDAAGRSVLDARWILYDRTGERRLDTGIVTAVEEAAQPLSYDTRIAAMSETVHQLSRAIAQSIAQRRGGSVRPRA